MELNKNEMGCLEYALSEVSEKLNVDMETTRPYFFKALKSERIIHRLERYTQEKIPFSVLYPDFDEIYIHQNFRDAYLKQIGDTAPNLYDIVLYEMPHKCRDVLSDTQKNRVIEETRQLIETCSSADFEKHGNYLVMEVVHNFNGGKGIDPSFTLDDAVNGTLYEIAEQSYRQDDTEFIGIGHFKKLVTPLAAAKIKELDRKNAEPQKKAPIMKPGI